MHHDRADLCAAAALRDGVDVACVVGPMRLEQLQPTRFVGFIPYGDSPGHSWALGMAVFMTIPSGSTPATARGEGMVAATARQVDDTGGRSWCALHTRPSRFHVPNEMRQWRDFGIRRLGIVPAPQAQHRRNTVAEGCAARVIEDAALKHQAALRIGDSDA